MKDKGRLDYNDVIEIIKERGNKWNSQDKALSPMTNSLNRTASWIIRNKETGEVIMETFDRKKVDALNTVKYEAVPISEYLHSVSGRTQS